MGGPVAYLALQISASLKRITTIYGLMAFGGLVTIFAAGYALDAVRTKLMFQFGGVLASLIVAGGLIVLAGCLVMNARTARDREMMTAAVSAPTAAAAAANEAGE